MGVVLRVINQPHRVVVNRRVLFWRCGNLTLCASAVHFCWLEIAHPAKGGVASLVHNRTGSVCSGADQIIEELHQVSRFWPRLHGGTHKLSWGKFIR